MTNRLILECDHNKVMDIMSYFSIKDKGDNFFPDFNKIVKRPDNIQQDWYDWEIENWGTKWNCYNCKKIDDNLFTFYTAWYGVPELIKKMSGFDVCKNVNIIYGWSSEDAGNQCGYAFFINGSGDINRLDNQSNEAFDLYFDFNPEYRKFYTFSNGTYQCIEEN